MLRLNLPQYSKWIKILSIIPIICGIIHLIDDFLPVIQIDTIVVSKQTSYRLKYDRTTYNVKFENQTEQFTEEVYNQLLEGDSVRLTTSPILKHVYSITNLDTGNNFGNDTGETYAIYFIGTLFIIPIFWIGKKHNLNVKQSRYSAIMILVASIVIIKILL